MRIKVSFSEFNGNDIVLPIHYLYSLHCLIYKMFTPEITHKLYLDGGFPYKDRKFKLFSYSRILEHGNVNKEQHTIQFGNNISFYFAWFDLSQISFFIHLISKKAAALSAPLLPFLRCHNVSYSHSMVPGGFEVMS